MHNRMFLGAGENTITSDQIKKLVNLMKSKTKQLGPGRESNIPAGYTYLGQMIAHDIVPTTNKTNINREFDVRASLVLDSIYGDTEYRKKYKILKDGKFLFSNPGGKTTGEYQNMDLLRDKEIGVLIPDKRNDQNLMVSQLHLFWQKLHNAIITNFLNVVKCGKQLSIKEKFLITRKLVVKIFQQVVVEDYLYNVIDLEIYNSYMNIKKSTTMFDLDEYYNTNKMPLEFTHAVLRFGHSMVRNKYNINSKNDISLKEMLKVDHSENIKENHVVSWRKFFGQLNSKNQDIIQHAFRIDLNISTGMENIPENGNFSIAELNLLASNNVALASGYEILKFIQEKYKNKAKELKLDHEAYKIKGLTKGKYENEFKEFNGIVKYHELPLWLFILLEASCFNAGLGKLGSTILAESIFIAVKQSRPTIFSIDENSKIYQNVSKQDACYMDEARNVDELFNGILDDYRRLTMLDIINFKERFENTKE